MVLQHRLYELAKQLYEEKFWDDYSKTDLIAIQLPDRKEPVIISVLGEKEHNYGFLVHRNLEELACFFEASIKIKQQQFTSMLDVIQVQHCLSIEYEDRKSISKEEYQFIKESGILFRGKKSWPVFVDYFPGYHPSSMDEQDIPLIIEVMEKFKETAKDFRGKKAFYGEELLPSKILSRIYQKNGNYIDGLFDLPKDSLAGISQLKKAAPILLTSFEMKRVGNQKIGPSIWELDIDFMNSPIIPENGERPYFPLVLLVVDSEDNKIICSEFFEPGDSEAIQRVLIQLILSENGKPPKIVINIHHCHRIARYLENLLLNLEIELIPIQKLPMISTLKRDIFY